MVVGDTELCITTEFGKSNHLDALENSGGYRVGEDNCASRTASGQTLQRNLTRPPPNCLPSEGQSQPGHQPSHWVQEVGAEQNS